MLQNRETHPTERPPESNTAPGSPLLRLVDCTVRYNGGQPAVESLNLAINAGERVALVGPSGAGKTTVIGLANATVMPTSGRVELAGVDTSVIDRRKNRSVRRRVATVHQDFALVPSLRVIHNVASGRLGHWSIFRALKALIRPPHRDEVHAILEQVGIPEKLWDRTDTLSGGQQQRVAIARALFQDPDLLLADEPVSNLDPGRSKAVLDVLVEVASSRSNRTLVASLHDAPLAQRYFDRIIGLHNGRLAFDLPAAEVTTHRLDQLYAVEDQDVPLPREVL